MWSRQDPIVGAGIVFAGPEGVLLAQEHMAQGYSEAGTWSGFEGRRVSDENLVDACTRETCEESLGLCNPAKVRRLILSKAYHRQIMCRITCRRGSSRRIYYVMHTRHLPEGVVAKFASRRADLLEVRSMLKLYRGLAHELPLLPQHGFMHPEKAHLVVQSSYDPDSGEVAYSLSNGESGVYSLPMGFSRERMISIVALARSLRSKLARSPWMVTSGALNPYTMTVNVDFLEKQRLHFFPADTLRSANQAPALRSFFRPLLAHILSGPLPA